jgi:hypothetical protein
MTATAMALARPIRDAGPEIDPKWDRSMCMMLAYGNCTTCHGSGHRFSHNFHKAEPCNCVLRAIFRVCFEYWAVLSMQDRSVSRVSYAKIGETFRPRAKANGEIRVQNRHYSVFVHGRPDEEYIADFECVARRALDDNEHKLFLLYFARGGDFRACAGKLGLDPGNFFHAVYRVEQKLGRALRETEPYALYPIDEYFHGPSKLGPTKR